MPNENLPKDHGGPNQMQCSSESPRPDSDKDIHKIALSLYAIALDKASEGKQIGFVNTIDGRCHVVQDLSKDLNANGYNPETFLDRYFDAARAFYRLASSYTDRGWKIAVLDKGEIKGFIHMSPEGIPIEEDHANSPNSVVGGVQAEGNLTHDRGSGQVKL